MPKYAAKVAAGQMSADQAADEAYRNFLNRLQQIHYQASAACRNYMGLARLRCVLREMIARSAQLRTATVGAAAV